MKTVSFARLPSLKIMTATNWIERLKGLMFDRNMTPDEGLFLERCNWVHSCFMNYSIDLVFLDRGYKVVEIVPDFKPWRMGSPVLKASHTLELRAGAASKLNIQIGDVLHVGA